MTLESRPDNLQAYEVLNANGRRLLAVSDVPRDVAPTAVVVLAPGFGRRILHGALLSRYLTEQGYATMRFDLTNHIGGSEGDILHFTMSSAVADLKAVVEHVPSGFQSLPRYVIAPSLLARAAVRAAAKGLTQDGLLLVLPVVDVAATIERVIGWDGIDAARKGSLPADFVYRVLHHDVSADFGRDAVETDIETLDSTMCDLDAIASPIAAIVAERDDWVTVDEVLRVMGSRSMYQRRVVVLETSTHDVGRNLPVLRLLAETVVSRLAELAGRPVVAIEHLDFDELLATIRNERRLARDGYQSSSADLVQ
jgi:hypothetical protein